jgi:hypothetical protein
MTLQEKALYHQIHPLKLLADLSAEGLSLYLFWQRRPLAGLVAALGPAVLASALLMGWADLEPYKHSPGGRYIRCYMTPPVVAVRVLGTVVTHTGAWYHRPLLIPVGLTLVLLAWLRSSSGPTGSKAGPGQTQEPKRTPGTPRI